MTLPSFKTVEEAYRWMHETVTDDCIDNHRYAYLNDAAMMAQYAKQIESGCCGQFDRMVRIGGRSALVGCNYGH